MTEEFDGDLADAVFWGADLRRALFRDVDLGDATITHASLVGVEIDGLVDGLVINGVDVTAYVNERDPWYPLRAMLEPEDAAGMVETWAALEQAWADTIAEAQSRPAQQLQVQVDGEWSFVETVRHMVFVLDKWFAAPILDRPFHPIGLSNTGSRDFPWPGVDDAADPSADEALDVLAERSAQFRDFLDTVAGVDLARLVDVQENGPSPIRHCINAVFEEAFWHNRYGARDLARLAGTAS